MYAIGNRRRHRVKRARERLPERQAAPDWALWASFSVEDLPEQILI